MMRGLVIIFGACMLVHIGQACKVDGEPTEVTIGEPTPVCLIVGKKKISFLLTADDYTALEVPGSYLANDNSSAPFNEFRPRRRKEDSNETLPGVPVSADHPMGTLIQMASMGNVSTYKYYKIWPEGIPADEYRMKPSNEWKKPPGAFTVLTAVILVDGGEVKDITWDATDGCLYECPTTPADSKDFDWMASTEENSLCKENSWYGLTTKAGSTSVALKSFNCLKTGAECMDSTTECLKTNGASCCDLQVYVAWQGTDKNGDHFKSSGKRFSRFRQYSVKGLFDSAFNFASSVKDSFVDQAEDLEKDLSSDATVAAGPA